MGWASGSSLAEEVWDAVRKLIPASRKKMQAARKIIEAFQDCDCDTIQECERLCDDAGLEYDEEYDEIITRSCPRARARTRPRRSHASVSLRPRCCRKLIDPVIAGGCQQPTPAALAGRPDGRLEEWADHCKLMDDFSHYEAVRIESPERSFQRPV